MSFAFPCMNKKQLPSDDLNDEDDARVIKFGDYEVMTNLTGDKILEYRDEIDEFLKRYNIE